MNNSQERQFPHGALTPPTAAAQLPKHSLRAEETAGLEMNLLDPPQGFAGFKAPPAPKVWMGQPEGLSDPVMAASVSAGQMVLPGVIELMAP